MEGRIEKLITSHKKWKTERYERATSKSSPIVRVMHKIAVSILTGFTNYCLNIRNTKVHSLHCDKNDTVVRKCFVGKVFLEISPVSFLMKLQALSVFL